MNQKRARINKDGKGGTGPVVYWMSRDQRVQDNWALLFAQQTAIERKAPLAVVFCLAPSFLNATIRHYGFMLRGLREVDSTLRKKNIYFHLLAGNPEEEIPSFITRNNSSVLITDFDPLRIKRKWKDNASLKINIPLYEVDAHNIVPCWIASPKQEYAAYTFRPKIMRALSEFLEDFPKIRKHPFTLTRRLSDVDWEKAIKTLNTDHSVSEADWIVPGEKAALKALKIFINKKLPQYADMRNDPSRDGQSNLSPYLHFGQLSAQRAALEADNADCPAKSKEAFLEELIVRRELSDNFCYYNDHYDSFAGFPEWSQRSLNAHRKDRREYIYSLKKFENAQTHDDLWNAAQMEMVKRGKMHGYMRMYWAKKILEWSSSPEEALETAIHLNDKYELDGRDPNGYTGIAWSIGGVHDRAWNDRRIFGKIRYMSYNGCKGKFDVRAYITQNDN
ncbi:MAG: deoxyribodipyrimidine photo-lyase [Nitrospirae bacterium]|nr:deoxyribodipyrimidine photo-lyase [Nitrospirota bacterium]